jgi:hypothetical protein
MFKEFGHQSLLLGPPPAASFISPFKNGHFAGEELTSPPFAFEFFISSIMSVFNLK